MKKNVDLTENMTFSSSNISRRVSDLRDLLIEKDYPWSVGKNIFAAVTEKSLVLVGNKKNRKHIRKRRQYESFELGCDRCGADISRKPWDKYGCLCGKCNKELEDDVNNNKQPWGYR